MPTQLHSSTRQQLDELDALLQKMLDQPGKSPDPPRNGYQTLGGETPPTATPTPPASVGFGVPSTVALAADSSPPETKPSTSNWNIDLNPRAGSSVLGERSPLADKIVPLFEPISPTGFLSEQRVPANDKQIERPKDSRYGGLTARPVVRDFLGYSGLAMLAASITWVALLWIGWF